jgi:hypothetical protein
VQVAAQFAAVAPVSIKVSAVELDGARAHAGWARRLAFDEARRVLHAPEDLLLTTDADTVVARDWLTRTLDHFEAGYDAVAGYALLDPRELRRLTPRHRGRLAAIRRYEAALSYVRSFGSAEEAWPRHFYEGGASMALTLEAYDEIGGAPTPRVGEDKALFDLLRRHGRRIRHPKDVRVLTSCRLSGRAPDGAADTLARWGAQDDHESLGDLARLDAGMAHAANDAPLTFQNLARETERARAVVRAIRSTRQTAQTG